mmetsp:Transcript_14926/g.35181  ORF Transcript_14926/g.35181 Transcript_14926/m.35181 type:complete len:246 (-) Transcript_14926:713-1450(-)
MDAAVGSIRTFKPHLRCPALRWYSTSAPSRNTSLPSPRTPSRTSLTLRRATSPTGSLWAPRSARPQLPSRAFPSTCGEARTGTSSSHTPRSPVTLQQPLPFPSPISNSQPRSCVWSVHSTPHSLTPYPPRVLRLTPSRRPTLTPMPTAPAQTILPSPKPRRPLPVPARLLDCPCPILTSWLPYAPTPYWSTTSGGTLRTVGSPPWGSRVFLSVVCSSTFSRLPRPRPSCVPRAEARLRLAPSSTL